MISRRHFLRTSAIAGAAARIASAQTTSAITPPVRTVAGGRLRGTFSGNLQVFLGIPFAQPPIGPLRFRAPQPAAPWTGVRDATKYGPAASQPGEGSFVQSEDCLYLNLWAPASGGQYPVLVWIHGGGFTGGRTSEPQFAGSHFAQEGVICITIAYRLGVFGFLDVSPLLGASYRGSASNGLRDLIAALEWVQHNVAAFGGDPRRVTIGGESAGAKLTDLLMGTPSAAHLFHQALSESGGAERIATATSAEEVSRGFGAAWTQQTQLPLASLLTAPVHQLIETQQRFMQDWPAHFPLRPELDSGLIPSSPLEAIGKGNARGKRVLIGTNRDESALFLGPHPKRPADAADLGNLPLTKFQSLAAKYSELYPDLPEDARTVRSVTAEEYWIPSLRVAEAAVEGGAEVFVYRLDFPGTGRFAGLAYHSYDLRFVWKSFGRETPTPPQQALAEQMHQAWVTFLRGEAPSSNALPAWPPYSLATRATMLFDQASTVVADPGRQERELWAGLLTS